jgi:hypothetical protein
MEITRPGPVRRLQASQSFHARKALKKIPTGHERIGTHLTPPQKKDSASCWWCHAGKKPTRGHLVGGRKAWKGEVLALRKRVEKINGRKGGRGAHLNAVSLFQDERLTEGILDFFWRDGNWQAV